jgi:Flp pilus assembly protein TadG
MLATRGLMLDRRLAERGQAVPLLAVVLAVLLGIGALGIDAGNWYQVRRAMQATTDAAALAGASQLVVSQSAATTAAQHEYALAGKAGDVVTYLVSSDLVANDSVTVTATRTVPNFLATAFGIGSTTISATSRATVESYTRFTSTGQVMPWAVMKQSFTPGQTYSIYTNGTSSNNGAIQPTYTAGTSCAAPSGANDYANQISAASILCPVSVGDLEAVKPGNNAGKTASGINARITTWETLDQIVAFTGNGQATILDANSQQLVMLFVVANAADGSTTWPTGTSGQVTVIGFAWFVITSCGPPTTPTYCRTSDGSQVNGTYVGAAIDSPNSTSGTWDPTNNTVNTIAITQ